MSVLTVQSLMTPDPEVVTPDATLQEAAKKMQKINCGALPVLDGNDLVGIITDRDIVTRAVALGKDPAATTIKRYITPHAYACNENDTLHAAAEKMHQHKVSRLVVKNSKGKVTGILSFGGIIRQCATDIDVINLVNRAAFGMVA